MFTNTARLAILGLLLMGCAHNREVLPIEPAGEPELPDPKCAVNPTADLSQPGGIYIPKDLDDSFAELKKMLHPDFIKEFTDGSEDDVGSHHFGLGMWMRNNWGLWSGSRLAKWCDTQGIKHPDDMSDAILHSFWRHLNGKPVRLEDQIKRYQQYWKEMKQNAVVAPDHQQPAVHIVEKGQDLASVAMMYMTTTNDLVKMNGLKSMKIQPGQHLLIPISNEDQ